MISQQLSYQAPGKLHLNLSSTLFTQRNFLKKEIGFQPSLFFSIRFQTCLSSTHFKALLLSGHQHWCHRTWAGPICSQKPWRRVEGNVATNVKTNNSENFEHCPMIVAMCGYSKMCPTQIWKKTWDWGEAPCKYLSCTNSLYYYCYYFHYQITTLFGQALCVGAGWIWERRT